MSTENWIELVERASLADLAYLLERAARELRARGVPDAPWQLNAAVLSIDRRIDVLRARTPWSPSSSDTEGRPQGGVTVPSRPRRS